MTTRRSFGPGARFRRSWKGCAGPPWSITSADSSTAPPTRSTPLSCTGATWAWRRRPTSSSYRRWGAPKRGRGCTTPTSTGFTVGGTGGEEDFVQTDERWWNAAWSNGRHEERVVHDANLGGYGLQVALRMHDPATGAAIGVIDATLAISALQEMVDELAAQSGNDIRILSDWGELLAETGSGHARDRIVRTSSETLAREPWRGGIGDAGSRGGTIEADVQRGWVRLNYAEGPHRDWIVALERKTEGSGAIRQTLTAAVALILAAVLGIAGGFVVRRRIAGRLRTLADHAESLSRIDTTAKIEDESNDEIGQLARSLEQLRRRIERAVQARHSQRRP